MAAGCDGDIFRGDVPAKVGIDEVCESVEGGRVAAWRVVDGEGAAKLLLGVCDGLEFAFPDGFDFGDVSGVSAAEHEGSGVFSGESLAEVLHEGFDAAAAGELFAEFCEAHVLRGIGKHHLRLLTRRRCGACFEAREDVRKMV